MPALCDHGGQNEVSTRQLGDAPPREALTGAAQQARDEIRGEGDATRPMIGKTLLQNIDIPWVDSPAYQLALGQAPQRGNDGIVARYVCPDQIT